MCQECVAEGRMTQAELDEANAKSIASGLPADFLKEIFGPDAKVDPDAQATDLMDEAVARLLGFLNESLDTLRKGGIESLQTPTELDTFLEGVAGRLLFRAKAPSSLAFGVAILAYRYQELLKSWATLYVAAAKDVDELAVNLDAAATPESKLAVTGAAKTKGDTTPAPGLYL